MADAVPTIHFASGEAWEAWLEDNHSSPAGVWMKIAKRGSGIESAGYPEVLDAALCFGWIDGQRKAFDEVFFLQRFTPRRARSRWSQVNRETCLRLISEGRMREAGLAEIERAKADGRWDAAYAGSRAIEVPEDLERELAKSQKARAAFAALKAQERYSILYQLHDARRPETRARRLAKFMAMLKAANP